MDSQTKLYIRAQLALYGRIEEIYFDVAQALHWHCINRHSGQWSALYRIQCELGYRPGACEHGPEPDSTAETLYDRMERWTDHDCQAVLEIIQEAQAVS